mmetsp:Transcript_16331/g.29623  ORF Transcript_16331/g.29623 Transcript_16331/m.29623 type:complete len:206 (-) Transcript_16331:69-686(-)
MIHPAADSLPEVVVDQAGEDHPSVAAFPFVEDVAPPALAQRVAFPSLGLLPLDVAHLEWEPKAARVAGVLQSQIRAPIACCCWEGEASSYHDFVVQEEEGVPSSSFHHAVAVVVVVVEVVVEIAVLAQGEVAFLLHPFAFVVVGQTVDSSAGLVVGAFHHHLEDEEASCPQVRLGEVGIRYYRSCYVAAAGVVAPVGVEAWDSRS